ncbi:hypothetical protein [Salinisphaera sp. LB1]|uniref:hypothetical protein n=1 Tax=Salinisphaera sp. LB1 TaxID=2183911 RepID=UPI000D7DBBCA|nr:hypothetical protein [Salinisphaera sp. LB1]AWN15432.1 hypothetical protein SALB1_1225 [Salinisphaera sp. LB1]
MRQHPAKTLALAVCGCTALWSVQAAANSSVSQPTLQQLQDQIQQLQQQVQDMKTQQEQQLKGETPANTSSQSSGPTKKLTIGGGVVAEYQKKNYGGNNAGAGDLILDYFDLNVAGQYGKLTYAADYRWSNVNFNKGQYLHNAWAAYDFGPNDNSQVKGGMFQVPFGNLPYGYQSFWGNLNYYAGFTDNQAAGIGYKYENNGWRFDLDAFKNQGLGQQTTYAANPNSSSTTNNNGTPNDKTDDFTVSGARLVNGGNARLGRTIKLNGGNTLNLSVAGRGGELEYTDTNGNTQYGTRWAGTLAAEADLGNWVLQGQFVDYKYNIPSDIAGGRTQTVPFEDYGYGYRMPAKGQLYSASVGRTFNVSNMGPISSFEVYNDYGYLHSGYGDYDNTGARIGDVQENTTGIAMFAGPVDIWAEWIEAKNGGMAFVGQNDGDWHGRFNLTAAFYFDGDLIKK